MQSFRLSHCRNPFYNARSIVFGGRKLISVYFFDRYISNKEPLTANDMLIEFNLTR